MSILHGVVVVQKKYNKILTTQHRRGYTDTQTMLHKNKHWIRALQVIAINNSNWDLFLACSLFSLNASRLLLSIIILLLFWSTRTRFKEECVNYIDGWLECLEVGDLLCPMSMQRGARTAEKSIFHRFLFYSHLAIYLLHEVNFCGLTHWKHITTLKRTNAQTSQIIGEI